MRLSSHKLHNLMKQAYVVAEMSHDAETKVGAVLVNSKSGAVIASGFNGFVRGAPDSVLPKTRPDKYKYIIHAEQNLLLNCARHGICTENAILICTLSPCCTCLRMIWQAGISEVYFDKTYKDFDANRNMGDVKFGVSQKDAYCKIVLSKGEKT